MADATAPSSRGLREGRTFASEAPVFDQEKFGELILYISEKMADDPSFGDTKLNKVLFFSDFFAYGFYGKPVTGACYQKLPFGPAPRKLLPVRRELEDDGAVEVTIRGRAFKRRVTVARREADTSLFDTQELDLVDEVISMLEGGTAAEVSNFSHDVSAGWQLVEMKEDIPYESVFISTTKPPRRAFDRGRELAQMHGW